MHSRCEYESPPATHQGVWIASVASLFFTTTNDNNHHPDASLYSAPQLITVTATISLFAPPSLIVPRTGCMLSRHSARWAPSWPSYTCVQRHTRVQHHTRVHHHSSVCNVIHVCNIIHVCIIIHVCATSYTCASSYTSASSYMCAT